MQSCVISGSAAEASVASWTAGHYTCTYACTGRKKLHTQTLLRLMNLPVSAKESKTTFPVHRRQGRSLTAALMTLQTSSSRTVDSRHFGRVHPRQSLAIVCSPTRSRASLYFCHVSSSAASSAWAGPGLAPPKRGQGARLERLAGRIKGFRPPREPVPGLSRWEFPVTVVNRPRVLPTDPQHFIFHAFGEVFTQFPVV